MTLSRYIGIVLIVLSGCQEVYEPEVSYDGSVLTVDGILTDKPEQSKIHLAMALPADSSGMGSPLYGAKVSVLDDLSHEIPYRESSFGDYVSENSAFSLQPGRKYTLHITTSNGDKYESSAQELISNQSFDKIYGRITTKPFVWKNHNGDYVHIYNKGIEPFIDFISDPGKSLRFKFNMTILIEYTFDSTNVGKYYAWKKWNINENINITETRYQNGSHEIIAHPLQFIPVEKSWYSLEPELSRINFQIHHLIIILDQYRLNEDTYSFYKIIREQLAADGKLFDPIAAQINGNIRCINDPSKLVFGNFEVSSRETVTFVVMTDYVTNLAYFKKVPNLINIPDEGAVPFKFLPDWWII
jgi:hypothetical protein